MRAVSGCLCVCVWSVCFVCALCVCAIAASAMDTSSKSARRRRWRASRVDRPPAPSDSSVASGVYAAGRAAALRMPDRAERKGVRRGWSGVEGGSRDHSPSQRGASTRSTHSEPDSGAQTTVPDNATTDTQQRRNDTDDTNKHGDRRTGGERRWAVQKRRREQMQPAQPRNNARTAESEGDGFMSYHSGKWQCDVPEPPAQLARACRIACVSRGISI